jgi:hypothetical protein
MRAAQGSGPRSRVEVVEMPVPEVRESEALIRISASGICRTETGPGPGCNFHSLPCLGTRWAARSLQWVRSA